MSHIARTILGVVVVASVAVAQLASGEDLTVGMRATGTLDQDINRAAKTDRGPIVAEHVAPTKTIGFHVERLPDTSIMVRIPLNHEARGSALPPLSPKGERKAIVACEPVVSALTEIARQLEPGRCVT